MKHARATAWASLACASCLGAAVHVRAGAAASADPRETLVLANRILAMEGLIGPFGHVSARLGPTRFLIARDEDHAGAQAEAADLVELDTSLTTDDVRRQGLYSEVFIHSAAYKAHPEVNAVVHTHSPYAIALGTLAVPDGRVLPTTNPGANLGNFIPVFSGVGLIQTPEQGQAVTGVLQAQNGVLLRGHGAVVIGATIEQAVLRAIYLEFEARTQLVSRAAGGPRFYQTFESDLFKATGAIDHPWHYYLEKLRRQPN
jgi:ribulose-5-phosphate 4-epimerase/fuculose-1-phosphate aldolase